ncbi:glycoside hydrolase family 13 protein [Leptothoe sp. PORK10 BA2]|uniref:glycoside hydrolase family 13 protein n=1 Tax=Leptothoe sp. PORK10 BA2 TaxID=3110254 RepID=UPI003FA3857E
MQIQTPDWVKYAVFYQIFPDRFARTQRRPLPPAMQVPLEDWQAPPTLSGYKGGDLWGVAENLDYLQDLGVNAIYFTPIFQSTSNHRYHTHDYYQVDPLLGGNQAFADLIDAAHQRSIKVVLDGVFNHASRGFFFFNDILENGPHSPWLDWFKVEKWPLSAYDGAKPANYESWWNNRALPEFNHDNPQAREYIMQIAEYWLHQGIDGWRLDVPFDVKAAGFWQEFRQRVKAINPEAYIVGEIWTDARQWLDGTQFDGVMNYLFTGPALAFTGKDKVVMELVENPAYFPYPALDAQGYGQKIEELLALYPWEIQLTQLNLLSSHDVARALTVMDHDQRSFELAVLLQMTFPGAPSIYYGDEVGLAGAHDPDCRRSFPTETDWNGPLLRWHQELIALRHQHPVLCTGTYQTVAAVGEIYAFARTDASENIVVVLNAGADAGQITLPEIGADARVLWGDSHALGTSQEVRMSPRSGVMITMAVA